MAIIQNSDYSVGTVSRLNQYQMDTAEAQKYRYHQLLNSNGWGEPYEHGAKKIKWDDVNKKGNYIPQNTPAMFNTKIQNFFFAPPSDNLWNVKIELTTYSVDGQNNLPSLKNTNLVQLYKNINAVNSSWDNLHDEKWSITGIDGKNKSKSTVEKFLQHLCENEMGVFLAQQVNFTPMSVGINKQPFADISQHGGFYKQAKVAQSQQSTDELKINFLISNWDITEILIDPWIAAINQHGLIADDIVLKAKIILTEYSASHEKFSTSETYIPIMEARKEYIFDNCVPISRDETTKKYNADEAGTYKNSIVTFSYDSYKIKYLF